MKIYANQQINSNSVQFSTYNARRDTFTFLKSNYKYKRRNLEPHQCHAASQCRGNAINRMNRINRNIATNDSATDAECNSINKVIKDTWTSWKRQKNIARNTYATLLRMLLLIISNSKKLPAENNSVGKQQHITNITKGNAISINAASNDDVNVDNDKMDFQRNDVKVLTATSSIVIETKTTMAISSPRSSMSSTSSSPSSSPSSSSSSVASFIASTTMCSSSSTKSTLSSLWLHPTVYSAMRISDKLFTFLAALFIAFAFCARSVAAGACWQTALDTGKCNEIFSLNITKAECCSRSQEFSYTERDLTEVEYFFATAIGGGMECAPCIESCKNIECGANKKCVKRKGRPKCICAPECGAAARRRRQHQEQQQQQQQQQQQKHYRGHLHHSEQLPRDIRSLSSEITNFNLGLDTRGDVGANNGANNSHRRNQNQRKMLILQSQRHHHQHQHHQQQHQQQQQRPLQVKAVKRLVIIGNVDPKVTEEHSTTRRLQVISNVRKNQRNRNAKSTTLPSNSSSSPSSLMKERTSNPSVSRHKLNDNNQNNNKQQAKSDSCNDGININQNHNNASKSNKNCNTNKRHRHSHQPISDNVVSNQNHTGLTFNDNKDQNVAAFEDDSFKNSQQLTHHRRKSQCKRKQHQQQRCPLHHPQHQHQEQQHYHQHQHQHQHQHRHRSKQQQRQKLQLERQRAKQKLKDQRQQQQQQPERNNTTMTKQTLLANGATFFIPSSSSSSNATTTTTTTEFIQSVKPQTSMATQPATFANSATSLLSAPEHVVIADRQHYLNHGSISATSSLQTSLGQQANTTTTKILSSESTASKISTKADKVPGRNVVGVTNNASSTSLLQSTDDFALLDGILENFDLHGFPNERNENMDFEILQHNSHPVCGTDGRTYHTECQLKKRACRTNNQNLQIAYRGHCKTSCNGVKCLNGLTCVEDHYMIPHCIICKINCTEDDDIDMEDNIFRTTSQRSSNRRIVIDPSRAVCGVDGKTYKSICDINRMICKIGRSIAVAYPGPCRSDRITCGDINCGPKHKCLVDLLTHEPRCVSCRYKCSRKRHPTELRYEEGKICGVNNRTYNSWCEMRKDSCTTGFFIDVKAAGQCQ